tara:strand:- start:206 stop:370 length:165 start_codon:yes stop_codon:yes gene_type:complete
MEPLESTVPKRFKVDTPMGSLESDSGNHLVDVASILIVILAIYVGKEFIKKWFK